MPRAPRIRFAAFALGMQAKAGTLDRAEAAALLVRAANELGEADPDYQAIRNFARVVTRRGVAPAAVAEAGAGLCAIIDRLNVPVPPDVLSERADIHG